MSRLQSVRLELARTAERPGGDDGCGYEFIAPLDDQGRLDVAAWRADRARCTVRRFWRGEADEAGELLHTRGGRWVFSYAPGTEDDEPIFRFDRHSFVPGEYVSITEHDGVTRPFRVVSVTG
ncbi:MAG: hypothetical protein ACK51F_20260 [Rhodospirillales bacterium]|jgi:hypothetical protein